jgi:peroxiredoxin Q/BCP
MLRLPILIVIATALFTANVHATALAVGAPAPDVTAPDQNGAPVHFTDVYAKGITLVYFYPKAGTSGCTAEACSLRDSYDKLKAQGLQIIGVSRDTVDAQKKFQDMNQLPFTLVADPDGKVAEAFGVTKIMGVLPLDSRESFIVKDGKIAWNSLKAQTKGSAAEVQKALDGLKG